MSIILIVDDEPNIRQVTRMVLESAGHNVAEAENGTDALSEFNKVSPDLVLLDIMMPDISGWDVCSRIKTGNANVFVVMFSVKNDEKDVKKSFELGADGHLSKVGGIDILLETVEGLLKGAGPPN